MKPIRFLVTGRSPLLMNSPKMMKIPGADGGKTATVPVPAVEAENGANRNPDGTLFFPSMAFRRTMETAGKGYKAGKRGLPSVLKGSVFPFGDTEQSVNLFDPVTKKPLKNYKIDTRRCCIGSAGRSVAVMRSRPMLMAWACEVEFEYDEEFVSEDVITKTFERGGRMCGIGNFSPLRGGPFGRFEIKKL